MCCRKEGATEDAMLLRGRSVRNESQLSNGCLPAVAGGDMGEKEEEKIEREEWGIVREKQREKVEECHMSWWVSERGTDMEMERQ